MGLDLYRDREADLILVENGAIVRENTGNKINQSLVVEQVKQDRYCCKKHHCKKQGDLGFLLNETVLVDAPFTHCKISVLSEEQLTEKYQEACVAHFSLKHD